MYTITEKFKTEIEVEHSTFISYLIPIHNEEEAKDILVCLRKEHPKARHICYAYNLNGNFKSSDDGEPKGTAGRPIMDVLERKNINNCLLAVVRYFGGTLLGAGRLLRTYVESATSVIEKSNLKELVECNIYKVEISPSKYDILKVFCTKNDCTIAKVEFNEFISLEIYSKSDIIENAKTYFNGDIKIEFLKKDIILK